MKGLKHLLLSIVSTILLVSVFALSVFAGACNGNSDNVAPQAINPPSDEPSVELTEYHVHLILTCLIAGDDGQVKEITCTYGEDSFGDESTVYTVKLGKNITDLHAATPPSGHTVGSNEYKFVGWYYENAHGETIEVDNNTMFTKEIFGDETEISIKVKCERIFSPMMPL